MTWRTMDGRGQTAVIIIRHPASNWQTFSVPFLHHTPKNGYLSILILCSSPFIYIYFKPSWERTGGEVKRGHTYQTDKAKQPAPGYGFTLNCDNFQSLINTFAITGTTAQEFLSLRENPNGTWLGWSCGFDFVLVEGFSLQCVASYHFRSISIGLHWTWTRSFVSPSLMQIRTTKLS